MAATKKTTAAAETAEVKAAAAPAEEKKAAAKKPAAKKAAAPKKTAAKKAAPAAEKKAAAPRKTAAKKPTASVYIQYLGAELTTEEIIAKAVADAGAASAKKVDVYVKPEENKVYYVIDGKEGSFFLV